MVARESQYHHRLNGWLTIDRHDSLCDATDRQDSGLRLIDDCVKCIHVVHTQVADRECAVADILESKLPGPRLCHQLYALPGNFVKGERIRLVDNWHNQPL